MRRGGKESGGSYKRVGQWAESDWRAAASAGLLVGNQVIKNQSTSCWEHARLQNSIRLDVFPSKMCGHRNTC